MSAKIKSLTSDQENRLVSFREEWRKIGTRTGHDLECESMGREAIIDAYKEVGVAPPSLILWAQSPLQALLMGWLLQHHLSNQQPVEGLEAPGRLNLSTDERSGDQLRGQLWDQLRGQLWDQLRGQLWDQLGGQLGGQLWDQLGGQLGGQLRDQLGGQLGDQLWDQLWDQLRDQLRGQLWDQLRGQLWDQLWDQLRDQLRGQLGGQLGGQLDRCWSWGQCEVYWSCYYRFAIDIGVRVTDGQNRRLAIWERLARAAFMAFSWRGVSILVQHPTVAKFDDRQRLHSVDSPALSWGDGYAVHAVHGIRLASALGEALVGGTLTARQVHDERNAEVRRVLVDAFNGDDGGRYLRELGAVVIHEDTDALGLPRRLLRITQDNDEDYVGIEVTNSSVEPDGTRKVYTFRCDPQLRPLPVAGVRSEPGVPQEMTCQNAIASTYGYYGPEFVLAVQT